MTPVDRAWLTGILEGEGCFGYYGTPRVSVVMGDKDLVTRAATLMRTLPRPRRGARLPHWSPMWVAEINGAPAAELMLLLRPGLGSRRGAKVDEILAQHADARYFVCPGCDLMSHRETRKKTYCSPRCKQRMYRRMQEAA